MHELAIKNMVCDRCRRAVHQALSELGLEVRAVELGRAEVVSLAPLSPDDVALAQVDARLRREGFELLADVRAQRVAAIKAAVIALVRSDRLAQGPLRLSDYLASALDADYAALTSTFSALEPVTLERYFILQKVELAKEWLTYGELPIKEIAFRLGYSSVPHLTNQFKQVTGYTPAEFRRLKAHPRLPLDAVAEA